MCRSICVEAESSEGSLWQLFSHCHPKPTLCTCFVMLELVLCGGTTLQLHQLAASVGGARRRPKGRRKKGLVSQLLVAFCCLLVCSLPRWGLLPATAIPFFGESWIQLAVFTTFAEPASHDSIRDTNTSGRIDPLYRCELKPINNFNFISAQDDPLSIISSWPFVSSSTLSLPICYSFWMVPYLIPRSGFNQWPHQSGLYSSCICSLLQTSPALASR